jgi:hypothetical protein
MARVTEAQWRAKHPVIGELLDGKLDDEQMHFIEQAIKRARQNKQREVGITKNCWIKYTDKFPRAEMHGKVEQVERLNPKTFSTFSFKLPYSYATNGMIEVVPAPAFMSS